MSQKTKTKEVEITPELIAKAVQQLTIDDLHEELTRRLDASDEAREEYTKAKEDGYDPVYIRHAGVEILYRALTRKEWRNLTKSQNERSVEAGENLAAQAEIKEDGIEEIFRTGLVWSSRPADTLPAGIYSVMSDVILIESGFAPPDTEPTKLQ